jgi:hypothetical protein
VWFLHHWVFSLFAAVYLAGWVASYFETSICQEPSIWRRVWLMLISLFAWPYVAWSMMRQMG